MPCAALARGIRAPVAYPGFAIPSAQALPFADAISNNPCGGKALTSVNGVSVAAQNRCMFHWMFENGQSAYIGAIVKEA